MAGSNRGGGMVARSASKSGARVRESSRQLALGDALARVGVEHREVELGLLGVEVDEEVVDLVEDLGRPGVLAVDLVDDDDRGEPGLQRLLEHEARLGQRALRRVHQQQDAVHQGEGPLDLAAEVGVAGRVHDVDLHALVVDGRVLGHDGDALLPLQVDRVHDPLDHVLVGAEDPGLPEHGVDQRGLAVVDVGDDGDVSDVLTLLHVVTVARIAVAPGGGRLAALRSASDNAGWRGCRAPTH